MARARPKSSHVPYALIGAALLLVAGLVAYSTRGGGGDGEQPKSEPGPAKAASPARRSAAERAGVVEDPHAPSLRRAPPKEGAPEVKEPDPAEERLAAFQKTVEERLAKGELAEALAELRDHRTLHGRHERVGPGLDALESRLREAAGRERAKAADEIDRLARAGKVDDAREAIAAARRKLAAYWDEPLFAVEESRLAQAEKARASEGALAQVEKAEKEGDFARALAAARQALERSDLEPAAREKLAAARARLERAAAYEEAAGKEALRQWLGSLVQLEEWVGRCLGAKEPAAADLDAIEKLAPPPALLEALILRSRSRPRVEPGVHRVDLQFDGFSEPAFVAVPDGYDPGRSYPLLVFLHGTAAPVSICQLQAEHYQRASRGAYLALVPHARPTLGWGPSRHGIEQVLKTLEHVQAAYAVDPDRVMLTGHSMGGHASWNLGLLFPDRFSAICPRAGSAAFNYQEELHGNLLHLGVYVIHGARDNLVPVDLARKSVAKLTALKMSPVYMEFPQSGHEGGPGHEIEKSVEWMLARKRDPWPRQVVYRTRFPRVNGAYWVRADVMDPARKRFHYNFKGLGTGEQLERVEAFFKPPGVTVRAEAGNRIVVESDGIHQATLYLHPRLADPSKPVTIASASGRTLATVKMAPTARKMIASARALAGRVAWDSVQVTLR